MHLLARAPNQNGLLAVLAGRAEDSEGFETGSRSGSIVACAILTWVICGLAVSARFYARGKIQNVLGKEDWCVLVAYLMSLGFTVATVSECIYGMGSHTATVTPENLSKTIRAIWVGALFYQLSLAFSKISILLLYTRLFRFHGARIAAWILIGIVVVYNIWCFCMAMVLCVPLQAYWDRTVKGATCRDGTAYMWALIGLHIGTDFLIFFIPIPVVWSMMALSRRQKVGLMLVFAMGFFVCIISVLRIVWIKQSYGATDMLWDYVYITYWNCVEVNGAIVLPCLVVLKPLLRKLWPNLFSADHNELHDAAGSDRIPCERMGSVGTEGTAGTAGQSALGEPDRL
ncbi:hypothetical protein QBC47DRAFT_3618 [Echria macrotheca]|uniref:Rhodopsin domain-containing protein n=1 Tax=Echria macrotheca TaxID=438768 RepID=A0AAJ0FFV5_9PEZI|nr:hypothetical protein QBC47DRAFT_3618 [Echria macrotheca]